MKLCANLSFMFTEEPALEKRYHLAKQAGFKYVECAFPYSVDQEALVTVLQETGLTQVLINTVPGEQDQHGIASIIINIKGDNNISLVFRRQSGSWCQVW